MVLAFFASIFTVNGVMIYSALSTYTGLVANEPYRKGLHYNERIAADARQIRLGWTDTLDVGRDGRVVLALADSGGRAGRAASRSTPCSAVRRPTAKTSRSRSVRRPPGATRRRRRCWPRAAG